MRAGGSRKEAAMPTGQPYPLERADLEGLAKENPQSETMIVPLADQLEKLQATQAETLEILDRICAQEEVERKAPAEGNGAIARTQRCQEQAYAISRRCGRIRDLLGML